MKKAKKGVIWAAGIVTLAILAVSDLLIHGPAADASILWMLRLPRIITAIAAGGALALSGAQMQSILGNPLADPHIMGITFRGFPIQYPPIFSKVLYGRAVRFYYSIGSMKGNTHCTVKSYKKLPVFCTC